MDEVKQINSVVQGVILMSERYIETTRIIKLLNDQYKTEHCLLRGKRTMYQAVLPKGTTMCACILKSKYHASINGYWVDINETQVMVLDNYKKALVIYCLEGRKFSVIDWSNLRPLLTDECIMSNAKEGDHWKTYIRNDRIEIRGGTSLALEVLTLN